MVKDYYSVDFRGDPIEISEGNGWKSISGFPSQSQECSTGSRSFSDTCIQKFNEYMKPETRRSESQTNPTLMKTLNKWIFNKYVLVIIIVGMLVGIYFLNKASNSSDKAPEDDGLGMKCDGTWGEWGDCTKPCDGTRTRLFTPKDTTNLVCFKSETQSCNTECKVDDKNIHQLFVGNTKNIPKPNMDPYLKVSSGSIFDCAKLCGSDPKCKVYSMTGNMCNLYSDISFEDGWSDTKTTVGVKLPGQRLINNDIDLQKHFKLGDNRNFSFPTDVHGDRTDKRSYIDKVDKYTCAELCKNNKDCKAYGYYSNTNNCELFYDNLSQEGQTSYPNLTIGKKY
jgi:hypothetical protein